MMLPMHESAQSCARKISSAAFLLFVCVFFCAGSAFSQGSGRVQLAVASPSPIVAGDMLTFQILASNTGSEIWDKSDYSIGVEIYDADKRYITKTSRLNGEATVDPGGSALAYIPFKTRESDQGRYFWRVVINHKEQQIVTSDYYDFTVLPLVKPPKPPSAVQLGGNVISSYSNTFIRGKGNDRYTASLTSNIIGRVGPAPVSFNAYLLSNQSQKFRLDNILFNYYGPYFHLAMGDVQPKWVSLVMYGAGMRGIMFDIPAFKRAQFSVIGSQNAESTDGTDTSNGVFSRYLFGGSAAYEFTKWSGRVELSGIYSTDDKGSIKTPGPTLKPIKDMAYGAGTTWNLVNRMKLGAEVGMSSHKSDKTDATTQTKDKAYRGVMGLVGVKNLSLEFSLSRVGKNYTSVASPTYTPNRLTFDGMARYGVPNIGFMSVAFNRYKDNLAKDASVNTTTQQMFSGTVGFQRAKIPSLTLSFSMNTSKGAQSNLLSNKTKTLSASLSHTVKTRYTLSLSGYTSQFRDLTGSAANLNTISEGLTVSARPIDRISFSVGGTLANIKNVTASTTDKTTTFNGSVNYRIISKLAMALWGTLSTRKNLQATTPAHTVNKTFTTEVTYNFTKQLALTVGGTRTQNTDKLTAANSIKENAASARVSLSF